MFAKFAHCSIFLLISQLVKKDIMAKIVQWFAILTAQRVETQTDFALVAQVG